MAEEAKPAQAPTDGAAKADDTTTKADDKTTTAAAPAGGDKTGTAGEPGDKAAAAAAAAKAPEKYALVIPKGAESLVTAEDLKKFEGKARARNLTNEQAQAALTEALDDAAAALLEQKDLTEKDTVYGGEQLEANRARIAKFVERVRPKDHPQSAAWQAYLLRQGNGNNLALFAFLADAAKLMGEDKPGAPAAAGAGQRSAAQVLYGDDSK